MPFPDLQSFIAELERLGQLKRVRAEVDPELEITEVADRVMKSPSPEGAAGAPKTDPVHGSRGGVGLLFDRVKGSSIPVAINLYGSYQRVKLALGCDNLEELAQRVQKLVKPEPPPTLLGKLKMLPELAKIASYPPKVVRSGMCQQVVRTDDADLFELPHLKCWPHDGGADNDVIVPPMTGPGTWGIASPAPHATAARLAAAVGSAPGSASGSAAPAHPVGRYITFAGIYTKPPGEGERNVGMYRIQVTGPKSAILHCHMHHDGARHQRQWAALNQPMPIAIVLGGESVLPYAATCPLPPNVSELLFAGFLNGGGIDLVPCRTVPLEVPVNAEIVIEGFVAPHETVREGPFGDHTGFYSLAEPFHPITVTAITHRKNPIYPTTIVGKPPMEDYYLGKATERIFLPLLQMLIPDVIDYSLPMWGAFHNFAFVRISKRYPYQARRVMSAIWGAGQMAFTKFVVVVDEEVDVHDEQAVMFQVGANVDPRRDVVILDGPLDILDHAAPFEGAGSKIGIDATRKIPGEGVVRAWPRELEMTPEIRDRVTRRWPELGL